MISSPLVSLNECARQLRIQPMSLWRWLARYSIPHTRISGMIVLDTLQVQSILIANGKLPVKDVQGE